MSADRRLKDLIRARMAATGEPYVLARRNVLAFSALPAPPPGLTPYRHGFNAENTHRPRNEFPLGLGADRTELVWDVLASGSPHLLVTGPTGSGRTGTLRTAMLHALTNPAD